MGEILTAARESPDQSTSTQERRVYRCDRCGFEMVEHNCKIVCSNCGSRYDCSDLSIYFDEPEERN